MEGAPADNFTVIGVVGDYVYANMYEQPQPVVFFSKPPQKWFTQLIYVRFRRALALVIAFLTISFQTIRAALANPIKSLRTE